MTLDELRDRIKNEVVLHEGELADWQWRQKGLVAEASELGINDFTRLVNDISRQVNRDFGKILDLKKKIVTLALQRQKKLTEADINQIATEADRVQLSRPFVTEQWIPAILEALPAVEGGGKAAEPEKPAGQPVQPVSSASVAPADKVESVRTKIKSILDDYDKHIQAQSLKFLFKAVDYDEESLAEEIRRYLSEHYYASVHPPRGATLKEKLISTDWRHLSWWEKEQPRSTEYAASSAGYPPASSTASPPNLPPAMAWSSTESNRAFQAPQVKPSGNTKKSGLSDAALIGLAILSALILIWVVLRITRGGDNEPVRKRTRSQASASLQPSRKASMPLASAAGQRVQQRMDPETFDDQANGVANSEPLPEELEKSVADFDQVDENVGEFGLRPAQKGNLWGYINESNTWVIEPQFDLATPFNNGMASVELDGIQIFIDRYGNRVRERN
ncbi:hypothetical protein GCM10027347_28820 [Larkinella harenae]